MKNKQKIILHLITGLNTGGAENMLKSYYAGNMIINTKTS